MKRNSTAGRKAHPEISKENAEHRRFLKEKERQLTSPQKQRNQKTAVFYLRCYKKISVNLRQELWI